MATDKRIIWLVTRVTNQTKTKEGYVHINKNGKCIINIGYISITGRWTDMGIITDNNEDMYFLKNSSEWNDIMTFIKNNKS